MDTTAQASDHARLACNLHSRPSLRVIPGYKVDDREKIKAHIVGLIKDVDDQRVQSTAETIMEICRLHRRERQYWQLKMALLAVLLALAFEGLICLMK